MGTTARLRAVLTRALDEVRAFTQSCRMNQGRASWVLGGGLCGLVAIGCGASDSPTNPGPKMGAATPDCGTVQEPLEISLKDVTPARGSSVPNANIVQSFTIVGKHLNIDLTLARPRAHTAGAPVPATISWTYALVGADTVYTSVPMSWTTAPGQVELEPGGLLVTPDNCVSVLPTPVFSYQITSP